MENFIFWAVIFLSRKISLAFESQNFSSIRISKFPKLLKQKASKKTPH